MTTTYPYPQAWRGGFNVPFYEGGPGFADFVPTQYQVALAGIGYIIDPSQYDRQTLPIRRQPLDDSIEPGEQSLNQEGVWRRSQDNFFLGAGQLYLDNRFNFLAVYQRTGENPSVRSRYWRSQGVLPFNEGSLSLLPEQVVLRTNGTGGWCIAVGSVLYHFDGTNLRYSSTPATGPWTVVSPPGGSWPVVTSPTTDGYHLWMAAGNTGTIVTNLGISTSSVMRATPIAPTVVPGTTGSTSYTYFVVGTDQNGFKTLVSSGTTISNGAASPNNTISWVDIPGIVSYDILRGSTSQAVALGVSGSSFVDTATSTVAYTAPTGTTENFQPDFLGYANGVLVGGSGPLLLTQATNGVTDLLWTHPNTAFHWRTSSGSPTCIYVVGDPGGGASEIYAMGLNSTTLGLTAPYLAGQVGNGELVRDITYYEGLVILGTSLGVRTGSSSDSSGHLTTGPVITDPGDCHCLVTYGAYCWFGWSDFSTDDGVNPLSQTTSGTGRLYLSQYTTDPDLPAYATGEMATTGTTGTVTSCAVIAGSVFFTIDGGSLWGPSGNLVSSGFIETGWIRYGLTQSKILVAADVRHDALNGSISIQAVPSGQSAFLVGTSDTQGSIGPTSPFSTGLDVGEAYQLIFTLNRDANDATKGPNLRRWTSEALPIVRRQDQIIVPIMVGREVMSPVREGATVPYDPATVFKRLKDLETAGTPVTYQEGNFGYTVYIDQIEVKPDKWADDFSFFEGVFLVKLLTLDTDI